MFVYQILMHLEHLYLSFLGVSPTMSWTWILAHINILTELNKITVFTVNYIIIAVFKPETQDRLLSLYLCQYESLKSRCIWNKKWIQSDRSTNFKNCHLKVLKTRVNLVNTRHLRKNITLENFIFSKYLKKYLISMCNLTSSCEWYANKPWTVLEKGIYEFIVIICGHH